MFAETQLTPAEQAKVPAPGYVPLTWSELAVAMSLPSGTRPRVYGHIEGEPHGRIVALRSQYNVDQYAGKLSFAWLSDSTTADLISAAR